jgi:hypothetical protein
MIKNVFTFLKSISASESLPEKGQVITSRKEHFFSELLHSESLPEARFAKVPAKGFLSGLLAVEKLPARKR